MLKLGSDLLRWCDFLVGWRWLDMGKLNTRIIYIALMAPVQILIVSGFCLDGRSIDPFDVLTAISLS